MSSTRVIDPRDAARDRSARQGDRPQMRHPRPHRIRHVDEPTIAVGAPPGRCADRRFGLRRGPRSSTGRSYSGAHPCRPQRRSTSRVDAGMARDATRRAGRRRGSPVVLTVCRLFPEKGPVELIRACAKARTEFPDSEAGHRRTRLHRRVGSSPNSASWSTSWAWPKPWCSSAGATTCPRSWRRPTCSPCRRSANRSASSTSRRWRWRSRSSALAHGGTSEVVEHGVTGLLSTPGRPRWLAAQPRQCCSATQQPPSTGSASRPGGQMASVSPSSRMAADVARRLPALSRTRKGLRR